MSRTILAAVDDMFFASKIRAVADSLAVDLKFMRSIEQLNTATEKPALIIVDLHNRKIDANALARTLKANEELRSVPLLGFFSHVQTELMEAATVAGFDRMIPRSLFSRDLAAILQGE